MGTVNTMRRRASLGLIVMLLAGCAHAGARAEASSDQAVPSKKQERILITGSRIPRYVEPGTQVLPSDAPVRVFSRGQLLSTGREHDLAAAMQALDPSVTVVPR